jgi:hypothetical protein
MYWAGWLWYGLKTGSVAGACSSFGHHAALPSTATPISGRSGSSMCLTAGKISSGSATWFSSGCCHGALGP